MEFEAWKKYAEPFFLIIADFLDMKEGDKLPVLILDTHVLDLCDTCNKPGLHEPEVFFSRNRHTIIKKPGFHWLIKWHKSWGLSTEYEETEIHLYHKEAQVWYPVDGKGNVDYPTDTDIFRKEAEKWQGCRIHWSEFPKDAPIGWRGPMIRWTDLDILPLIQWNCVHI